MNDASLAGWPADARALVERARERHGFARWRAADRIALRMRSLGGPLPRMKGLGRTHPMPARIDVFPHARRTILHDYPAGGCEGLFDNGAVQIRRRHATEALVADPDHRASFRGLRKHRRWSALDALYFLGYALWHYHALPFALDEARPIAVRPSTTPGLTALEVEFPADVPTHGRRQTFHFAADGLLRRHDYTAEIVSRLARGSHFWDDYVEAGGVAVALRRTVYARLGRRPTGIVVLEGEFERDVDVV